MKYGAIFVLYKPEKDIIERVSDYITHFVNIEICVVDNSDVENRDISLLNNVSYFFNGNRGGIAGALNKGVGILSKKGCDFIFTFDQDSVLPDNFFESMDSFIKIKKAEVVCPNFFDVNSKTYAVFLILEKWRYSIIPNAEYTTFAISSGMGFYTNIWQSVNGFSEDLIIDHVDTDFCLKVMGLKEKIFVNYDICLNHAIGQRKVKKLLGVTFKPNNHNHIRRYYISRNGMYLSFKYFFKYPSYFYLNILRMIHEIICVLFYEKRKRQKISYIIKGIFHSMINRLGPY
ncbi:glycosyltransferase [Pectobacterium aroidearum]|uniref:glycosyltransferase n=1 Tax=Pectobacterium aroidearum TaxID=1201031 RepID=UPI0015DF5111|nr:glycosyltransferase [Pectobacterium aroidearum]MBA0205336.1 glycosyltransferase [Pectobacterium aroidearum]